MTKKNQMNREHASINRTARLAGGLHLSLVPLGFFSFAYVPSVVVVRGDPAATSQNILSSELLFRAGIISHLMSQIVAVFLLLALFRLLRSVNKDQALTMLVLGLLCVPISFLAELNALGMLHLLGTGDGGPFTLAQVQAQAMQLLDMHRSGVLLAQVFWALWMLPLAGLVFRSGFLPKWLCIPVLIAAAGYLFDSGAHFISPGRATVSQVTAIGELWLPLWLLVKGAYRRQNGPVRVSGLESSA